MSDNVEYEPVPESDLHEYQQFHINKAKTEAIDPSTGGIAAEALGIPAIVGAKSIKGLAKNKLAQAATDKLAEMIAPTSPSIAPKPPIPTTVGEFHAPNMVTEHGFGPGAVKNVSHNIDMDVVNELDKNLQQKPIPGFERTGNSRIATPVGTYPSAPPPQGGTMPPQGGTMPPVMGGASLPSSPAAPPPLTPTQRAMQVVKGAANSPVVRGAGAIGGLWEGGENLVRLFNHFKEGNIGRELLDVAGVVSNAATLAPTPFSPWSNIGGAVGSGLTGYAQRHLEEQDKLQKKATGGLVYLR